MPLFCQINAVCHWLEQTEDEAPTRPFLPPLNAGVLPQHVSVLTNPYSDASVVWRKALSHLWGSRASTLRHRTQAEHSLVRKQVPIRCKAGQKTFYHGCNNLFLAFYIPLWRFHTQIARGFFCPHLAVLWAVRIPPQCTHYTVAEGYHNHPGMRWLSHGALLNTAVRWPSWRINIWSMEKCSLRGKVCY